METVIGFAIGYLVGTRHGRDGLRKVLESVEAIRSSPEVRQAVLAGVSVAGSASRQVLRGDAGEIVRGAVEALAGKVKESTESAARAA